MKCKHMHKDAPENAVCEDCNEYAEIGERVLRNYKRLLKGGKENDTKNN